MIIQEWPAGTADPDFPEKLPEGYEAQSMTDDKVGDTCIRTLILQKTTIPACADHPD